MGICNHVCACVCICKCNNSNCICIIYKIIFEKASSIVSIYINMEMWLQLSYETDNIFSRIIFFFFWKIFHNTQLFFCLFLFFSNSFSVLVIYFLKPSIRWLYFYKLNNKMLKKLSNFWIWGLYPNVLNISIMEWINTYNHIHMCVCMYMHVLY